MSSILDWKISGATKPYNLPQHFVASRGFLRHVDKRYNLIQR
jgi:hypothetical protein